MAADNRGEPAENNEDVSRRSYMQLLGALGLGSAASTRVIDSGETDVARAAPDGGTAPQGITVSDSGTDVGEGVTRLNFEGALSPIVEDDNSVQVQQSAANPNIVNVQTDLGVQPRQGDVWGAIYEHYQSFRPTNRNHRYVLPPGTWHVETDNIHLDAHEHFELVGSPLATLKVNDQGVDLLMTVGTIDTSLPHAQRTIMRDLRIDIRGDYDAGIGRWYTYALGVIENITMRGQRDRLHPEYGGDLHTLMVAGRRPGSTNVIRQCLLTNGHAVYDPDEVERGYAIGFSAEPPHRGTNIWDGCQISGYGSGFYVSTSGGQNIITGSHVQNCGRASIRIGANDRIQDSRVTMTRHPGRPWTALWLENGGNQTVENLQILNQIEKDTEVIRLTQDGPARLSNVHISDEGTDGRAIRVADNDQTQTIFEGCSLTDRSSPNISDYAIYVRSSNVTFRDCDFDIESQSDRNRHGIYVIGSGVDKLSLDNCDIEADVASLRFRANGADHNVRSSFFDGLVMSDANTTLENVLWLGNRHYAGTAFRGNHVNWQGDFNFGYDV